MRAGWAIFKRELLALFVTPLAWVVMTTFLLIQGLHFYLVLAHFAAQTRLDVDVGPMQTFFGQTVLLYLPLLFICPVLTMRTVAEERRSGTIEPLLTTPTSTTAVVLGKYAAVLCLYALTWVPTLSYVRLAAGAGHVDMHTVASGYLAVLLVGAGYLSIGMLSSAVTRSQLSAAIISAMVLIGLFMLGIGAFILPEGLARDLCAYLSVWGHMNDFSRGLVDSRRLVLDATTIALPLFVAVRAIDAWRSE